MIVVAIIALLAAIAMDFTHMYSDPAMTVAKGEYKTTSEGRYVSTLDGTVAIVAKGKGIAIVDAEDFTWIKRWLRENDTITVVPDGQSTVALVAFIGTIVPPYRVTVYDTPKQAKFRSVLFEDGRFSVFESDVGATMYAGSYPVRKNIKKERRLTK